MRVGDYVMTARRLTGADVIPRGTRGTVLDTGEGWVWVEIPGRNPRQRFYAREDQLIRLVPAANHKQEAFVGRES